MEQFIILGYLPGSDIQIGFETLAKFLAITTVVYLSILLSKEKKLIKAKHQELINQQAI